jgi:hypothetical protein
MVIRSSGSSVVSSPERPLVSSLPERPSLESLRNQAKTLQCRHRDGEPEAPERVSRVLEAPVVPLALHDAQFARSRGCTVFEAGPSWSNTSRGPRPNRRVARRTAESGSTAWRVYAGQQRGAHIHRRPRGCFSRKRASARHHHVAGDSGLGFRLRWATRAGDNVWCGRSWLAFEGSATR